MKSKTSNPTRQERVVPLVFLQPQRGLDPRGRIVRVDVKVIQMVVDDERAGPRGGADGVGLDAVRAQNVGELVHVGQRGREAGVVGRDAGAGEHVVALVSDVAVVAEEKSCADCDTMSEWGVSLEGGEMEG